MATLQALLASERDEDIPNPNIQLCEGLFAVYISFLVRALSTSNCSELFRLVAHPLDSKMWSSVFGGGAKVVDKTHSQCKFHFKQMWYRLNVNRKWLKNVEHWSIAEACAKLIEYCAAKCQQQKYFPDPCFLFFFKFLSTQRLICDANFYAPKDFL